MTKRDLRFLMQAAFTDHLWPIMEALLNGEGDGCLAWDGDPAVDGLAFIASELLDEESAEELMSEQRMYDRGDMEVVVAALQLLLVGLRFRSGGTSPRHLRIESLQDAIRARAAAFRAETARDLGELSGG